MKIGIPKAFIYWKRPKFWENFFKALGFQVVLSKETNKKIIDLGVKNSDPETCFAEKVYFGHLLSLEKKCDLIFVPRLKANKEKLEYCPKFFALPELSKILVKKPILTCEFDERKEDFKKTLLKLAKKLGRKEKIKKAILFAQKKEREILKKREKIALANLKKKEKKIILISHPYNLFDDYVNLKIKEKIRKLKAIPIFLEDLPEGEGSLKAKWPDFHWEFAEEIKKKLKILFSLEKKLKRKINGAIEISSFNCGCDAVLKEFIEKEFKLRKIPFLYLIIDEHTGEAGFQTRLEAFLDTFS